MLTSALAEHRAAALADAARVEAEPPVAVDEQREADPRVGAPAPDRVELGRGVEARLVGLDDPEQPVALEVAVGGQPVHLGGDPRLRGRVADGDLPGPGQQRRLDRLGLEGAARGDVVEGQAAERDRPVPEDRVADEAVVALGGEQGLQLGPRPRRVEAPPDDRREAGVPVPLPRVAARAGAGVGEGRRRRARPRASSAAGRARRSAGRASLTLAGAAHFAQRQAPRTASRPARASDAGPGFGPGDAADEALARRFDDVGHRVDFGDAAAARAAAGPAARRRWW